MEQWKQPETIEEIRKLLSGVFETIGFKLDKSLYLTLLSGFRVIVKSFEIKQDVDIELSVNWIKLYLDIHSVAKTGKTNKQFSTTVPIAITYFIGLLIHGPNNPPNFLTEILDMMKKVIINCKPTYKKKLESYGHGTIAALWSVLERAGNFQTQFQIVELLHSIFSCLNMEFVFNEIKMFANLDSKLEARFLKLLPLNTDNAAFYRLTRKILNSYNLQLGTVGLVKSFHCDELQIQCNDTLYNINHSKYSWIDINTFPYSLNFVSINKSSNDKKSNSIDVAMRIKNIYRRDNIITITSYEPCKIEGFNKASMDVNKFQLAYARLPDHEIKRFVEIFADCDNNLHKMDLKNNNENKKSCITEHTKKDDHEIPSSDLYESATHSKRSLSLTKTQDENVPHSFIKRRRLSIKGHEQKSINKLKESPSKDIEIVETNETENFNRSLTKQDLPTFPEVLTLNKATKNKKEIIINVEETQKGKVGNRKRASTNKQALSGNEEILHGNQNEIETLVTKKLKKNESEFLASSVDTFPPQPAAKRFFKHPRQLKKLSIPWQRQSVAVHKAKPEVYVKPTLNPHIKALPEPGIGEKCDVEIKSVVVVQNPIFSFNENFHGSNISTNTITPTMTTQTHLTFQEIGTVPKTTNGPELNERDQFDIEFSDLSSPERMDDIINSLYSNTLIP